jgi:hypothetical protein
MDFEIVPARLAFEVKTEMIASNNLFVQTHEGSHKTNLAHGENGAITQRDTDF